MVKPNTETSCLIVREAAAINFFPLLIETVISIESNMKSKNSIPYVVFETDLG